MPSTEKSNPKANKNRTIYAGRGLYPKTGDTKYSHGKTGTTAGTRTRAQEMKGYKKDVHKWEP